MLNINTILISFVHPRSFLVQQTETPTHPLPAARSITPRQLKTSFIAPISKNIEICLVNVITTLGPLFPHTTGSLKLPRRPLLISTSLCSDIENSADYVGRIKAHTACWVLKLNVTGVRPGKGRENVVCKPEGHTELKRDQKAEKVSGRTSFCSILKRWGSKTTRKRLVPRKVFNYSVRASPFFTEEKWNQTMQRRQTFSLAAGWWFRWDTQRSMWLQGGRWSNYYHWRIYHPRTREGEIQRSAQRSSQER